MKRVCAASLALLLLLAALSSCTVTFSGGTQTTAGRTDGATGSAGTEAQTTDGATDLPAETTATETEAEPETPPETTAPETEATPEQTDDEYTKNY